MTPLKTLQSDQRRIAKALGLERKKTDVHPVHMVIERDWDSFKLGLQSQRPGFINVHLSCTIYGGDRVVRDGNKATLWVSVNTCGPDARYTCDGPIENDHSIYDATIELSVNEGDLPAMRAKLKAELPALLQTALTAYDAEVLKAQAWFDKK